MKVQYMLDYRTREKHVAITNSDHIKRNRTLKTIHVIRLFLVAALFGFTAIHCAHDNPVDSTVTVTTQGLQLIQMPHGLEMKKETAVLSSISAVSGGEIALDYMEADPSVKRQKKMLNLHVEIRFDRYSVSSDFVASLNIDAGYLMPELAMQFGPHGTTFLKPATLEVYASGLDLSWVPAGETLKLYYDNDGEWEEIEGDVSIDRRRGELQCLNGKLPHFSRYAFGRVCAY